MSVSTCASQRAAFPRRPPASISSVFSPSRGGAERYCSFSPPKGAGHACRGATRRSAHRLPFAKQTQHLHKWRQIVIPVVAKVSRMLQQLQSEKERIWWMILTIEVVRWIMLKLKKHQHTAESWQTLAKQVFNRWGLLWLWHHPLNEAVSNTAFIFSAIWLWKSSRFPSHVLSCTYNVHIVDADALISTGRILHGGENLDLSHVFTLCIITVKHCQHCCHSVFQNKSVLSESAERTGRGRRWNDPSALYFDTITTANAFLLLW